MSSAPKILVTGGHITPALAVIDHLLELLPAAQIVFVGRKYNNAEMTESFEYQEICKRGVRFHHLHTGRTVNSISVSLIRNTFAMFRGFYESFKIIQSEKPDLVMSFGGYVALPVSYAAFLLRTPIMTHEQTIHPGRANRRIAQLAQKVFIAFPEASRYISSKNITISGNPIRKSLSQAGSLLYIPKDIPCLYVTGGSLGSHAVNCAIEKLVPELIKSYCIIHQTGNVSEFGDYERLCELRDSLPARLRSRYIVKTHIGDDEIGQVMKRADLVIGRSGANTFFELVATQKPAILVPLPEAAFDEQRKHAEILKHAGAAVIYNQDEPVEKLMMSITNVMSNLDHYRHAYQTIARRYRAEATQIICDAIMGQLDKK